MNRVDGDLVVSGRVNARYLTIPPQSIKDAAVASDAAIAASKLQHRYEPVYAQASDADAAAETRVVHVMHAAGTLIGAKVGAMVACIGDAVITFDVRVNGVSVLTATQDVDSSAAAATPVNAVLDQAKLALIADDIIEVVVTVNAGTGTLGKGAFAIITLDENAI